MRSLLTVATLSLVMASSLAGQTTLALKGGLGRAKLATNEAGLVISERTGVVAGAEFGFALAPSLGLRLGGMFAQKGSNISFEIADVSLSARTELDYLQGIALVRFGTPIRPQGLAVGLLAGGWAGYLLSCSVSTEVPDEGDVDATCEDREAGGVKSMDFGLAAGVGLEAGLSGLPRLAVDLLWAPGRSKIDSEGTETRHVFVQAGFVFLIG